MNIDWLIPALGISAFVLLMIVVPIVVLVHDLRRQHHDPGVDQD